MQRRQINRVATAAAGSIGPYSVLLSPPAIPLIGDVLSHTVASLLSRLMWPFLLRKIFGPSPVPKKFQGFPEEMAVRPSQIRAKRPPRSSSRSECFCLQPIRSGLTPPRSSGCERAARLSAAVEYALRLFARIIAAGTLTEIPGIGDAIADIVTKLHQPGSHPSLEKLRKEVPIIGAPGSVGRAETLRNDAFQAELAAVPKHDVTGLADMFVQLQAGLGTT
jgi:hypothetical protein